MPGNGGILPDQNSFSVPVEMPVWAISTTMSSGPGASSATDPSSIAPGLLRITATVSMTVSPFPCAGDSRYLRARCQFILTLILSIKLDGLGSPRFRAVTTPVMKGRTVRLKPHMFEAGWRQQLGDRARGSARGRSPSPWCRRRNSRPRTGWPQASGHRLGNQQKPALGRAAATRVSSPDHIVAMVVEHAHQADRIRSLRQAVSPEVSGLELNALRQPLRHQRAGRGLDHRRQVEERQPQIGIGLRDRGEERAGPPPTSISRDTPSSLTQRRTSSATSAWEVAISSE